MTTGETTQSILPFRAENSAPHTEPRSDWKSRNRVLGAQLQSLVEGGLSGNGASASVIHLLGAALDQLQSAEVLIDRQDAEHARHCAELQESIRAKAEFLTLVSHELRTPLTSILGYVELLLGGIPEPLPPAMRSHVEHLRTSAMHQVQLVNEIIRFAKPEVVDEAVTPERIDLSPLIAEIVGLIAPGAARKGLDLDVRGTDATRLIHTDPTRLRQILLNLLWNAVKFTQSGGVTIQLTESDHSIDVSVADTGPGIPPEIRQRVFEPFFQARRDSRSQDGVGLGLTVSQRLARALGGTITVQSEPGVGSTFTLSLPRGDGAAVTR